ncbi:ribosome 60S biogenesis N-terminal-domain-containing protein [Schizophyllum commune]
MPKHATQAASEPPRKRQKTDATESALVFASAQAIRNALRAFDPDTVTRSLTALRNQLTIRPTEEKISTQDARLALVDEFLQLSPGAQDVLQLWETSNPRQPQLPALCCSVLACMLTLLSTHLPYHAAGMQIVRNLLQDQWSRRLFVALTGSSNDLILATLKLLNALANFASGRERKAVVELLPWEGKTLPKLLNMRRRSKSGEDLVDALARPDIRTLTLLLILSPLTSSSPYKAAFLEQHIPGIALALKGLHQDPPSVVKHVLEVFWEGLWCDPKVKRTLKVALFGETTMGHLLKLYDNPSDETRDVLHHFLLAICTRPGTGVCFRDRGWYPREDLSDVALPSTSTTTSSTSTTHKIHNRILAHLLKHLKPNEDPRQHELTLRILAACPELVTGYWTSAGLTLEPRLSSRWLVNIALAGEIVSLPVPKECFYLDAEHALPNPSPPPLNAIIAATLPGGPAMKAHWTKALQHAKPLVQHAAALSLARSLAKYAAVLEAFDEVGAGEADEGEGAWAARRAELEREVRRRVPEFGVIVGLSRVAEAGAKTVEGGDGAKNPEGAVAPPARNPAQRALLGEAAARLMWLYHRVLPGAVREVRVDVGRALVGMGDVAAETLSEEDDDGVSAKLRGVQQLHVLRLLQETEDFAWWSKPTGSTHTYFYLFLKGTRTATLAATRTALRDLTCHLLAKSVLFQDTPNEPALWLACLPAQVSELDSVVCFLDDCVQRCLKTPYRYMDDLRALAPAEAADELPSPLLATVLEQAKHKVPTAALAVFVRRLLLTLSTTSLRAPLVLRVVQERLDEIWSEERLAKEGEVVSKAVRREVGAMKACLARDLLDRDAAMDVDKEVEEAEEAGDSVPFESLLLNTTLALLHDADHRQALVLTLAPKPSAYDLRRAFCLVLQHLESEDRLGDERAVFLHLMADLAKTYLGLMSSQDSADVVTFILHVPALSQICTSVSISPVEREGKSNGTLGRLIGSLLPSRGEQVVVSEITTYWLNALSNALESKGLTADIVECASPWLPYLSTGNLVQLFDLTMSKLGALDQTTASTLIARLLDVIGQAPDASSSIDIIAARSSELLSLRTTFTDRALLDRLLVRSVTRSIPLAVDGIVRGEAGLPVLIQEAEQRWCSRHAPLPELSADAFLGANDWDDSVAQIVSGMIYKGKLPESTFVQWMQSDKPASLSVDHLAMVLGAYADSNSAEVTGLWDSVSPHASRLFKAILKPGCPAGTRRNVSSALRRLLETLSTVPKSLSKSVVSAVQKATAVVSSDFLGIFVDIDPSYSDELLAAIVERSVRDLVDHLSDERAELDDVQAVAHTLNALVVRHPSTVKTHSVETFLTAVVHHALALPRILQLAVLLAKHASMKPFVVNRNIQAIVQNAKFARAASTSSPSREPLIHLLYTLFQLHPTNTCQISHVEPLLQVYRGTLSSSDRRILAIFQLFEAERSTPITTLISRWSSAGDSASQTALDAVQSLDPILVLRTCLNYPKWRDLSTPVEHRAESWEEPLYDPIFLVLLFAQMILECPPTTALAWVEVFRTNIVSLMIRMMSAREGEVRELATNQLASLWLCLEGADMQEKDHALYVLSLLKDALSVSSWSDDAPKRLPTYTTLILAHALRAIFYPTNFIYPLTARFLLQRPLLDVDDVPMLYGMLYSSSDDWKKERGWILKFLADGMCGTDDWRVFKRRHTWDLLASMFQSAGKDKALRSGVLEVLANLTCVPQAATSLIIKSGLLSWIEMQTRDTREEEAVIWVRILENCMALADIGRVETATRGEWRSTICRSLSSIAENTSAAQKALPWICRATVRLSCLPGRPTEGLSCLIRSALRELQRLETRLDLTSERDHDGVDADPPLPPHRAASLHDTLSTEDLPIWGRAVKDLWRAAMQASDGQDWGALTARLLLWRGLSPARSGVAAEWVRKETLRSMNSVYILGA